MKIKFEDNINKSKYYLIQNNKTGAYFFGSTTTIEQKINRRVILENNIKKYICNNCIYREYSNIKIILFYLFITNKIIDLFNKEIDSIFKDKNNIKSGIIKDIFFNYKDSDIIINIYNNKYLFFESDGNIYFCKYSSNIKESNLIKGINISNILINKKNLYSYNNYSNSLSFLHFIYLIEEFAYKFSSYFNYYTVSNLEFSDYDLFFNSLKNKENIQDIEFKTKLNFYLFFSIKDLFKDSINSLEFYFLTQKFYFIIEDKNNNKDFLYLLNQSLSKILYSINKEISYTLPSIKKEKNFCNIFLKDFFNSYFSENCKLGIDIINNNEIIPKLSTNKDIKKIINNSLYIKNNKFYYKKNIFPLKIDCEIGLFFPLEILNYKSFLPNYLLVKKDNLFYAELFGNVLSSGFVCTGDLYINLDDTFKNLTFNLNKIFNSIYTLEHNYLFYKKPNFYLNSFLNIHCLNEINQSSETYKIIYTFNNENFFISSIYFSLKKYISFIRINNIEIKFSDNSFEKLDIF